MQLFEMRPDGIVLFARYYPTALLFLLKLQVHQKGHIENEQAVLFIVYKF